MGVTVFLIGHVTKTGEVAGPKMLEHMVDTVLFLEGESGEGRRWGYKGSWVYGHSGRLL